MSYDKPADVQSKFFPEFRAKLVPMTGKTVAITGCTSGTGYIAARVCLELGARVIMLNRPSARADQALASLKAAVPGGNIELVACDLMSFASVRQAGAELVSKLDSLDVLCNNAGIMATVDQATVDGCDTQMQTNHLSHFLLTSSVWPLLEKAAELRGDARVVNHSSGARNRGGDGKKPLDRKYLGKNGGNLGGDQGNCLPFSGGRWTRYQQTKLANVVFTYALRDRQSKVKSLVAHPGPFLLPFTAHN
jgi:NAD(P)-dependent dehydrogenase (short-subunit alcohol dehydrogenase family)